MNEHILSALIGAVVATLGWVVTYFQQQWSKGKEQKREFLRRQVEEFYAPLLALVQHKLFVQQVQDQRMASIPSGDPWVKALRFFEDNHIVPTMSAIGQLLRTKSYLAVDWPESFDKYLEHEAKSVALYQLWRNTDIPGDVVTIPWPEHLEEDVKVRKSELERRLRRLYGVSRWAFGPTTKRGGKSLRSPTS